MAPRPDVSQERRAQIIEAALACFIRHGYVNTTMDDIVAESGLSKGTLYWYFDSKDDLFQEALLSVFDGLAEASLDELTACETATERLRVGLRCMIELCQEFEGYFSLIIEFWAQSRDREQVMDFWAGTLSQYQQLLTALFEEGIRSGEFKSVDAGSLAWMLMAAYDGLAVYDMMMPHLDLDRINETFVEALLKGVEADDQSI